MEQKLTAAKAAIVGVVSAVCGVLGWKGIMALVWILVMGLDYLSGTAAACKKGDWNSARAREGLWHKAGMLFAVIAAAISDGLMLMACGNIPILDIEWPCLILPLVLAWYILTELGSILENAVKLGATVPQWLTKMLKASLTAVDKAGEKNTPDMEENVK